MKVIIALVVIIFLVNWSNFIEVTQKVVETPFSIEQVSITSFPKNYQLHARDTNNKAQIKISGNVEGVVDSLIAKVHRDNGIISRSTIAAKNNFSFTLEIEAIKHDYTIALFAKTKKGDEILVKKAMYITAGDVYVISGQSNAWAIDYDNAYDDEYLHPNAHWVRTIGAMHVYNKSAIHPEAESITWYLARAKAPDIRSATQLVGNGMVGVLGMNIGLNLVASEEVPIAIVNGAGGGGAISFYQKTTDKDLNVPYGRLQNRLEASGVKDRIKAFIWNQGENNAGDSVKDYKIALNTLYSSFKSDYSFDNFYIVQTPPGCNSKTGHQTIREAQRQFVEEKENTQIITRHGFPSNPNTVDGNYFLSDGCHYHAYGYEVLANWIANLARYDFYDGTVDFQAPKIIGVKLESSTSLVIEFDKAVIIQPDLLVNEVLYSVKNNLFAINNEIVSSISTIEFVTKNQRKIHLTFSDLKISKGDYLTYILGDNYLATSISYRGPWIVDAVTGVGVVGFTKTIE